MTEDEKQEIDDLFARLERVVEYLEAEGVDPALIKKELSRHLDPFTSYCMEKIKRRLKELEGEEKEIAQLTLMTLSALQDEGTPAS